MLTANPFAALPSFISAFALQVYVIVMILLVVVG